MIDWYNTILYDKAGHPTGVASIGHEITIDVTLQTLSQEEREALSRSYLSGQMEEQLPHDLGSDPERLGKLKRRRKELDAAIEVLEKIARARHPELASQAKRHGRASGSFGADPESLDPSEAALLDVCRRYHVQLSAT